MDLETVKNLLKKREIQPKKHFGQNFLIDELILEKIKETAELGNSDFVLEIGPGLGALTKELAKTAKRVVAIEKDRRMVEILKETLKDLKNVEITEGDILNFQDAFGLPDNYKLVANIPYYITSPLIRKFLETEKRPKLMVLMVQKEVAQRICSKPPRMNLLAVSVQFYAEPKIISYISKKSFWPQPKVDSAIIKIIPRKSAYPISVNPLLFFKIVKAGFSQPRKQLLNNLSKRLQSDKESVKSWLLENKIQPEQRAETLNIHDWINLTKNSKWINF